MALDNEQKRVDDPRYRTGAPNAYEDMPEYDESGRLNGGDEAEEERMSERLAAFAAKLASEAKRRVDRRSTIEQRWLADLRQYHGIYDPTVAEKIKKNGKSGIFINQTRTKTDSMTARLFDLLFPTDDRNWGIRPTPVPEMSEALEDAILVQEEAQEAMAQEEAKAVEAKEAGDEEEFERATDEMGRIEEVRVEAEKKIDELHELLAEATRRANLMQEEIDDQLKECQYAAEAREMIEDGCKIGMGVMKGPVTGARLVHRYRAIKGEDGAENYELRLEEASKKPGAYRIDPWGFFPDPDSRVEDSEGFFERHLKNKKQMRALAREPGVNKDAVRRLLASEPRISEMPSYMIDLHGLTGQNDFGSKGMYQVWEYTGPIDADDIELLAEYFEDEALMDDLGEVDLLEEYHARVWFCDGEILRFGLHPLDTGEPIYSVFNLVRDESGPYGFGVPHLMRDPQDMLNATVRMMMDNGRNAVGPQIVINKDVVSPQDGSWRLTPEKIWVRNNSTGAGGAGAPPFETYDIPMRQAEMNNMIELAMKFIDDVTGMPRLAQGEQGVGVTKTAQGMAILMNSANVVFRRIVRNYDDNVTVPMIRRFYHFNMQFSEKVEIKGDYEVDARGSSVLLVREMQAQNLVMIAQMFSNLPIGKRLKDEGLLRQIFQAHMLPAAELIMTDREMREKEEADAKNANPEMMAMQAETELKQGELELRREEVNLKAQSANLEWTSRVKIAELQVEAAREKLQVEDENADKDRELEIAKANQRTGDQTKAELIRERDKRAARKDKMDQLAIETAMAEETGKSSGGSI